MSLLHRLSGVDVRVFGKREIVLRSTNGVRYVILAPALQRAAAAGLVVLAVGAAWTAAGYRHACRLADRAQLEIARVEEAHLLTVERRVAAVEKAAQAGRAEGDAPFQELAARNEMLRRRLSKMEQGLASAESERVRASAVHESLVERLRLLDRQARGAVALPMEVGMLLSRAEPGAVEMAAGRDP